MVAKGGMFPCLTISLFCLEEPGELLAPGLVVDAEENSGGSRGGSLLSYNQIPLSFC